MSKQGPFVGVTIPAKDYALGVLWGFGLIVAALLVVVDWFSNRLGAIAVVVGILLGTLCVIALANLLAAVLLRAA